MTFCGNCKKGLVECTCPQFNVLEPDLAPSPKCQCAPTIELLMKQRDESQAECGKLRCQLAKMQTERDAAQAELYRMMRAKEEP